MASQKKVIKIKCEGTQYIDFHELNEFQEDIKSITKDNLRKLKDSIIVGIKAPQFVWKYEDKWYVCDGHQRLKAFYSLEKDGWYIPNVPVVEIFAKTKKEAKQNVLLFMSQHGDVDSNKIKVYIKKHEVKLNNIVIKNNPVFIKMNPIKKPKKKNKCPKCGCEW